MLTKRLLVLANSIKRGGHCIAGREVLGPGPACPVGEWVRPVSPRVDGELAAAEATYPDGTPVGVLDVADVTLVRPAGDAVQNENWVILGPGCWRRAPGYPAPALADLAETPRHLWLEPGSDFVDRVAHRFLVRRPPDQTLYGLQVADLRIACSLHVQDGKARKRRRALFHYGGVEYDLALTDPRASERYCPRFAPVGQPPVVVQPAPGRPCWICVSLTPVFRDNCHYKVVATVLAGEP